MEKNPPLTTAGQFCLHTCFSFFFFFFKQEEGMTLCQKKKKHQTNFPRLTEVVLFVLPGIQTTGIQNPKPKSCVLLQAQGSSTDGESGLCGAFHSLQ